MVLLARSAIYIRQQRIFHMPLESALLSFQIFFSFLINSSNIRDLINIFHLEVIQEMSAVCKQPCTG